MTVSGTSTVVVFALALLATTFVGCADERVCPSGSFFDDAAGACRAWSVCAPGSFVEGRPSETGDRRCQPCAEGSFSTVDNASECQSWGDCAPGQAMVAAGTSVSDRQCLACSPGHFSSGANAAMCSPWTVCPAGSFVQSAGSFVDDQSCAPCPEGTQTLGPNRSRCVAADECAPGSRVVTAGSASTPADCARCNPGEHCPGGNASAEPCGEGHWDHDGDPATACIAQRRCGPGFEVAISGSAVADHFCRRCAAGHFSAEEHNAVCTVWSDCAPGTRLGMAPAATRDQQCLVCEGGWNTEVNAEACTPWSDCAAGTFVVEATTTADRQCAPCAEGTYSSGPNWEECLALEHCSASESTIDDGSSTTPVRCGAGWVDQFSVGRSSWARILPFEERGVLAFGSRRTESSSRQVGFLRRYASDGSLLWSHDVLNPDPSIRAALELPDGGMVLVGREVLQRWTAAGGLVWESPLGVEQSSWSAPRLLRAPSGGAHVLLRGIRDIDGESEHGEYLLEFDLGGNELSQEFRGETAAVVAQFGTSVIRLRRSHSTGSGGFADGRVLRFESLSDRLGWSRYLSGRSRADRVVSDGAMGAYVYRHTYSGAVEVDWVRSVGSSRTTLLEDVGSVNLICAVHNGRHYVALDRDLFVFERNAIGWSVVDERRLPFDPAQLLATEHGYFVRGWSRESRWATVAPGDVHTAVMFVAE